MACSKRSRRNNTKPSTVSFLSLPYEIRHEIYFLVIRPDCKKGSRTYCDKEHEHRSRPKGRTNLLVFCKQIYGETIEMLHAQEQSFFVSATEMQLFRRGKDYPRPHVFHMNKKTSRCYTPPRLSELEFARLRKLELILLAPQYGSSLQDVLRLDRNAARNISTTAKAVSKMTHLQQIRLSIRHDGLSCWQNWTGHQERFEALTSLLKAIISKRAVLLLGSNSFKDGEEFMQGESNVLFEISLLAIDLAGKLSVPVQLVDQANWYCFEKPASCFVIVDRLPYDEDTESLSAFEIDSASEVANGSDYPRCLIQSQDGSDQDDQEDQVGTESRYYEPIPGIAGILKEDYKVSYVSPEKYKMVSECRQCLEVFASRSALIRHLKHNRSHRVQWRYRRENKVYQQIGGSRERKCWTCGRGYASLEYLDKHLDGMKHRRHGIIPRYCEDNAEYDQFWARWRSIRGWL